MTGVRVRFAPSPTGALHIGGVRTALYNYLFAKKTGGTFIIRIEDTDQARYVSGAEDYILESLKWCGLLPDEGPEIGGNFGPYRQSERKEKGLYKKYAQQLIDGGYAYYAFDTADELNAIRSKFEAEKDTFKYSSATRMDMTNSLTISSEETAKRIESGEPFTIRLKVPDDELVVINDLIRGEVTFQSNELDDKIILKSDGMPTYHMANIVDDHLMEISHVIRGEEWLSSTAHHVLLYRYLGWEDEMPQFAHLPLILKPTGKGKLSKRDGDKLGIPVFPLSWDGATPGDSFTGFREFGFLPEAVNNFLAFLGWNPGTEQEIFSLEELCEAFSLERIGKSGARFDFDKAKWYNQQYIMATSNEKLAKLIQPMLVEKGYEVDLEYVAVFCGLMKERVSLLTEFVEVGYYFFEGVTTYDEKNVRKRWKTEQRPQFEYLSDLLTAIENFTAENVETVIKEFINESGLKFGEVFPILRIALAGSMSGPDLFKMIALLGKEGVLERLNKAFDYFDEVCLAI
jgi:glutamyl-tRNA synthetase